MYRNFKEANKMEENRYIMINSAKENGLSYPEVLRLSQQLDNIIMKFYRKIYI